MSSSMRLPMSLLAGAASLALLAGSALAQSSAGGGSMGTGSPGPAPLSGSAAASRAQAPAPNPLKMEDISNIKGTTVYGSDDKKIGTISTVLMKPESKTVDRLVVGEGGVLGVGSHRVALPVGDFSWDAQKGAFKLAKSAADLKSMPEWKEQLSEASGTGSAPASSSGTGSTTTVPSAGATGAGSTMTAPSAGTTGSPTSH